MQAWNVVVNGMDGARCTVLVGPTSKSNGRRRTDDGERDCGRERGEEEPPPGISAASFQFEEAEERSVREADREKHDCSSILLVAVASAVVLLYAIAKQENGG